MLGADPDAPATRRWAAEVHMRGTSRSAGASVRHAGEMDIELLWRDALEVAAAKLAGWSEARPEACEGSGGTLNLRRIPTFLYDLGRDVLDAAARDSDRVTRRYPPLNAGITSRANQRSWSSNSLGDRPSAQWIM